VQLTGHANLNLSEAGDLIPGFARYLFAEQKAHIIRVSAHQLAVAVARVTEGFAGTPNDSAVLISNDSIAVFEAGFVTNDLVMNEFLNENTWNEEHVGPNEEDPGANKQKYDEHPDNRSEFPCPLKQTFNQTHFKPHYLFLKGREPPPPSGQRGHGPRKLCASLNSACVG
jgi:hypothetical protein